MGRITTKTIRSGGNGFIKRLSFALKEGSINVHLILDDDKDKPHTHPWDFTSFLILPYKEEVMSKPRTVFGYHGFSVGHEERHGVFSIVRRTHDQYHRVSLYRIFGIKIPALTIGRYSKKLQLCSFCKDLGYCKEQGKP